MHLIVGIFLFTVLAGVFLLMRRNGAVAPAEPTAIATAVPAPVLAPMPATRNLARLITMSRRDAPRRVRDAFSVRLVGLLGATPTPRTGRKMEVVVISQDRHGLVCRPAGEPAGGTFRRRPDQIRFAATRA